MKKIFNRIYSDFFLPSRLKEYEELLLKFRNNHYEIYSIREFWKLIKEDKVEEQKKYLILRHDIDTDVKTAIEMWRIERKYNINSSYYFRLKTFDVTFMNDIEAHGGESGYHYEEIASYCKKQNIREAGLVEREMNEIKNMFLKNIFQLREASGLRLEIAASHGDFVNRYLKIPNLNIFSDQLFRERAGIELEVYDAAFMSYVQYRYSDTAFPRFWKPSHPSNALAIKHGVVYVLIHPRHWRANIAVNLSDNYNRVMEGFRYSGKIF